MLNTNDIVSILMGCVFILVGIILIFGSWKNDSILSDPPESLAPFYFPSFVKKYLSREEARYLTIISGILAAYLGCDILWDVIKKFLS